MTPLNESTSLDKVGVRMAIQQALDAGIDAHEIVVSSSATAYSRQFTDRILSAITPFLPSPQPAPVGEGTTPRVDAALAFNKGNTNGALLHVARTLERELEQVQKQLQEAKDCGQRVDDKLLAAEAALREALLRIEHDVGYIEELKGKIAAAQSELGEAKETITGLRGLDIANESIITGLRHQLEEARKDSARLDWLEKNVSGFTTADGNIHARVLNRWSIDAARSAKGTDAQ